MRTPGTSGRAGRLLAVVGGVGLLLGIGAAVGWGLFAARRPVVPPEEALPDVPLPATPLPPTPRDAPAPEATPEIPSPQETRGPAEARGGEGPTEPDSPPEPRPEAVVAFLRGAVQAHLPRKELSEEEYDRLARAILRIRAIRREMGSLEVSPEKAERLRVLRAELLRELGTFDAILEMSAAEFTRRVEPEAGITPEDDDEPPAPGDTLEEWVRRDVD